jgi:hypothetical protein
MRKYNFDEYYKKNLPVFSIQRVQSGKGKAVRRKPRPEEEWKAFFILIKSKWDRCFRDGTVEKTGERKYSLKI